MAFIFIKTLLVMAALFWQASCSYGSYTVRTVSWPAGADSTLREVILGPFEVYGHAAGGRNLSASLAFALQERGFVVIEQIDAQLLLAEMGISSQKLLSSRQIVQMAGRHGARLYLQGRIEERLIDRLLEEHTQVMADLYIYDAWQGKKLGTVKVFGDNLEQHGAQESLQLARILAKRLDNLIKNRPR